MRDDAMAERLGDVKKEQARLQEWELSLQQFQEDVVGREAEVTEREGQLRQLLDQSGLRTPSYQEESDEEDLALVHLRSANGAAGWSSESDNDGALRSGRDTEP